ncbi:MAG: hypothetical protein DI582_10030 [Azospirillum brasilense]|nr:MAG: hypothetical protein DI582_10030 [Azospirillum brasilense]
MRALANSLGIIALFLGVIAGLVLVSLAWEHNPQNTYDHNPFTLVFTFYSGLAIVTLPVFIIRHLLLPSSRILGIGALVCIAIMAALIATGRMDTDGFNYQHKAVGLFAMLYGIPHIIDLIRDMRRTWRSRKSPENTIISANNDAATQNAFERKILYPVARSCLQSLKGQERLGIVFWRWGILLYLSSIIIGFIFVMTGGLRESWIGGLVGWLGLILIVIYPFVFCFSLWRCSKNAARPWHKYATRIYAVALFPAIHIWASAAIAMGAMVLIGR